MSRALVAIGVAYAPPLAELSGAILDAKKMAGWAKANGFEHVHKLTDEPAPEQVEGDEQTAKRKPVLQAKDVLDICRELLALPDLEQLIIFFSGHGYAPLPGHELWLLPNWHQDPNEAINVTTSLMFARKYERPRISFIADACRQSWNDATGTMGMVVIPRPPTPSGNSEVDEFYSTAFGDAAQQVELPKRLAAYGVFSREVLKALNGAASVERDGHDVVTSRSLQDYLREAVPDACAAIPDADIQHPTAIAQWRRPHDVYAEWAATTRPAPPHLHDAFGLILGGPSPLPSARGMPRTRGRPRGQDRATRAALSSARRDTRMRIEADTARYAEVRGRASYETGTGTTVVGAEVARAVTSAGKVDVFEENGAWQVRLSDPDYGDRPSRPAMMMAQIADGRWADHWVAFPAFPGLVATALIDDDGFSSLNYRPAGRGFPADFEAALRRREAALAEAAAMFRRGILPDRRQTRELLAMARAEAPPNPTLAVLAAHVCYRQNDIDAIFAIEEQGIGGGPYTLPDFLILTDREAPPEGRTLVGTLPVMAPAWGLLPAADFKIDPRLHEVARGLVPSLWTMAKPEAGALLAEIVGATSQAPEPEPLYA